jgi:anti-sigma factor RsiW
LAAAAIVCVAVSGVLYFSHFRRQSRARSLVDAAVTEHRSFGDGRALDVQSSSPELVTTWFAQRLSIPFRMPNAGIAADDRAKYTLAGGSLIKFGGEPAALLEFRMPNNRISLLVSSDKLAVAAGGKVTRSAGLSFHAEDLGEFHVATWDNKGLTYALISSAPMGSSHSCSTCHRDSPTAIATLRSSHDTFWHAQPLPEISANRVQY